MTRIENLSFIKLSIEKYLLNTAGREEMEITDKKLD